MSNVFPIIQQFFSWLGTYTSFLTGNTVLHALIILVLVAPTLFLLIRRHIL